MERGPTWKKGEEYDNVLETIIGHYYEVFTCYM